MIEVEGDDARSKLLSLTEAGAALISRSYQHWQSAQARARALLSAELAVSLGRLEGGLDTSE